jgi:hypothetical protein
VPARRLLLLALLLLGPRAAAGDGALLSLLALGDTGAPPGQLLRDLETQMRVGRELAREDQRDPVDGLLLLGDLFYPDGLRADELEARVRGNLVEPYCRFLDLGAPLSPRVALPCRDGSRPVPTYAVLGNHDRETPESIALMTGALPRYLANWHLPATPAEAVELGAGVSLVLYDPRALEQAGSFEPLGQALRQARGPWRILVSHYPIEDEPPGSNAREALAALEVPFQLHLAGHEHNLQIGVLESPRRFLQVVSGGGSEARWVKRPIDGARFQLARPGYARIDLVDGADGERLAVSLVATSLSPYAFWEPTRVVSRWSVDLQGVAREESAGGR